MLNNCFKIEFWDVLLCSSSNCYRRLGYGNVIERKDVRIMRHSLKVEVLWWERRLGLDKIQRPLWVFFWMRTRIITFRWQRNGSKICDLFTLKWLWEDWGNGCDKDLEVRKRGWTRHKWCSQSWYSNSYCCFDHDVTVLGKGLEEIIGVKLYHKSDNLF